MKALLEHLLAKQDLTSEQARELLLSLAPLAIPESMAASILIALRAKGESAGEIAIK